MLEKSLKRIMLENPYHDKLGRFASKVKSINPGTAARVAGGAAASVGAKVAVAEMIKSPGHPNMYGGSDVFQSSISLAVGGYIAAKSAVAIKKEKARIKMYSRKGTPYGDYVVKGAEGRLRQAEVSLGVGLGGMGLGSYGLIRAGIQHVGSKTMTSRRGRLGNPNPRAAGKRDLSEPDPKSEKSTHAIATLYRAFQQAMEDGVDSITIKEAGKSLVVSKEEMKQFIDFIEENKSGESEPV